MLAQLAYLTYNTYMQQTTTKAKTAKFVVAFYKANAMQNTLTQQQQQQQFNLQKAAHITAICASVKAQPEKWRAAFTRDAAWEAAYNDVFNTTWDAERTPVWDDPWEEAYDTTHDAVGEDVWDAAGGAILAIIDMTPDELLLYSAMTADTASIILRPAVTVLQCK